MDDCDYLKFDRIKIRHNEIWVFQYKRTPDKALIKIYDFCGKYIGKVNWDEKSFDEY